MGIETNRVEELQHVVLDINVCQNLKLFLNIYLCTTGGIHPPRAAVTVE